MIKFIKSCDKDFIETVQRSKVLRGIVYVSLAVNAWIIITAATWFYRGFL